MRIVIEEILQRAPTYEVDQNPTFRYLDLGFATIPAGLEALQVTFPDD